MPKKYLLKTLVCNLFSYIDVVAAAIGFARDEIIWYIKHFDQDFLGKRKQSKKGDTRVWYDANFSELLWLLFQLRRKIVDNKSSICT